MAEFKKTVEIIGGGTVSHIRSHLALSAIAYGTTARRLKSLCQEYSDKLDVNLHLTRMADAGKGFLETNKDISNLVDKFILDPNVKIIFFNPALVDFNASVNQNGIDQGANGKYEGRLHSNQSYNLDLHTEDKIIGKIRKTRKDTFLVGFKTTCNASEDEQYIAGLNLLKASSCNLVLANDTKTRTNMIITPEEARYHVSNSRDYVLKNLVEIAYLRSHLTFTRSTVIAGEPVPWQSDDVPASLRSVVDYCIKAGAYKPFRGSTVGHFAVKLNDTMFLTSRRKTNFNDLDKIGLVKIETDGPDTVLAYGSKPSVGGQSQRKLFNDHKGYDSIVHFHCPIKNGSLVPQVSQRAFECGSHECGENTSNGLKKFGNLSAIYLTNHGPNIVFNKSIDPNEVINFIKDNFDLTSKTGGPVKL